jgi:hypothetical protein
VNEDQAEQRFADWGSQQPLGVHESKETTINENEETLQVIGAKITERRGVTNIEADSGKGSAHKTILPGKKPDGLSKKGGDGSD